MLSVVPESFAPTDDDLMASVVTTGERDLMNWRQRLYSTRPYSARQEGVKLLWEDVTPARVDVSRWEPVQRAKEAPTCRVFKQLRTSAPARSTSRVNTRWSALSRSRSQM